MTRSAFCWTPTATIARLFLPVQRRRRALDGSCLGPRKVVSLDWDGIWDALSPGPRTAGRRKVVIPSRTLSFARGLGHLGLKSLERTSPESVDAAVVFPDARFLPV